MGSQPCWNTAGNNFESAADGVAVLLRFVDLSNHCLSNIRKHAADHLVVSNSFKLWPGNDEIFRHPAVANGGGVAENLNPKAAQKDFCQSAGADPGRRFPGAGALQDVAGIDMIEFERSC